ncbi:MAG: hypothetical protein ACRDZ4_06050 [Egibacteraceae bacterium]
MNSQGLLVLLTVIEVVALVAVLALFLILIAARLRSIAETLGHVAGGASTIESHVRQVGPGAGQINKTLGEIVGALPGIAQKAETLADIVEQGRAQPQAGGVEKTRTKFTYYDR